MRVRKTSAGRYSPSYSVVAVRGNYIRTRLYFFDIVSMSSDFKCKFTSKFRF